MMSDRLGQQYSGQAELVYSAFFCSDMLVAAFKLSLCTTDQQPLVCDCEAELRNKKTMQYNVKNPSFPVGKIR